jgi:hypothetical protein
MRFIRYFFAVYLQFIRGYHDLFAVFAFNSWFSRFLLRFIRGLFAVFAFSLRFLRLLVVFAF